MTDRRAGRIQRGECLGGSAAVHVRNDEGWRWGCPVRIASYRSRPVTQPSAVPTGVCRSRSPSGAAPEQLRAAHVVGWQAIEDDVAAGAHRLPVSAQIRALARSVCVALVCWPTQSSRNRRQADFPHACHRADVVVDQQMPAARSGGVLGGRIAGGRVQRRCVRAWYQREAAQVPGAGYRHCRWPGRRGWVPRLARPTLRNDDRTVCINIGGRQQAAISGIDQQRAVAPVAHEVDVVTALHHACYGQCQRAITAGSHAQPGIGLVGEAGGVHHDDARHVTWRLEPSAWSQPG